MSALFAMTALDEDFQRHLEIQRSESLPAVVTYLVAVCAFNQNST